MKPKVLISFQAKNFKTLYDIIDKTVPEKLLDTWRVIAFTHARTVGKKKNVLTMIREKVGDDLSFLIFSNK